MEYICDVSIHAAESGDVITYTQHEPITRCRDCEHAEDSPYGPYCNHFYRYTEPSGYCGWGESK